VAVGGCREGTRLGKTPGTHPEEDLVMARGTLGAPGGLRILDPPMGTADGAGGVWHTPEPPGAGESASNVAHASGWGSTSWTWGQKSIVAKTCKV
jgi:hypothetical protein